MKEIKTPEADFPVAAATNYASKYLDVLRKERSHIRDSFIHILLVAAKLKPASLIIVNKEGYEFLHQAIKNLGLRFHEKKLDNQDTAELFVAREDEKLREYEELIEDGHADNVDWAQYEARQGRIFGYSEQAIAEFNKNQFPHKFWVEVNQNKVIPDEIVLAFGTTDMIPAGINDQQTIEWGTQIKNFLDKIDPAITKKLVADFKEEILTSAKTQIEQFK